MKIAIISDIHGNIDALESVLQDIKKEKCSKIFCLGDIAMAGPEPSTTISKIRELIQTKDFYIIQGNTDSMLSVFSFDTHNAILEANEVMASAYLADSNLLNEEEKNFLKSLPEQKVIELFGIKILLVHGSPRKNNEDILPNTPLKEVEKMVENSNADVILCGHTHIPCGFQTENKKTIVNVGSVGRPFTEKPRSCYLKITLVNGQCVFEHRFVDYNIEKAASRLRRRKFTGADKLADMLHNPELRHF